MVKDKFSELINLMNRTLNEENDNIFNLSKEHVEEALKELFRKQKSPMEYLRSFKYKKVDMLLPIGRSLHYNARLGFKNFDFSQFLNFSNDKIEHIEPVQVGRGATLKRSFLPAPIIQFYLVKTSKEHETPITTIFIERTNRYFFSGDEEGCIKLFNLRTGELISEYFLHNTGINDINLTCCGKFLISSDSAGSVKAENLENGQIESHNFGSGILLVESLNDCFIVLESSGTLHKIDKKGNDHINNIIPSCEGAVGAVCISEGANILLVGGSFPFVLLFNLRNFKNEAVILDTDGFTISYVCASRKRTIFLCSTFYNYLFYFEFNVGKGTSNYKKSNNTFFWRKYRIQIDLEEYDYIEKIIFLNDDRYFITTATDNKLRVYKNKELKKTQERLNGSLLAHPFLNVFLVFNYEIKIYDVNLNLLQFIKLDFFITEISFSDDGYTFIVSDELGQIHIYTLFSSLPKVGCNHYIAQKSRIPVNEVEIACLESLEMYSMDITKIKKKYFYEEKKEKKQSESTASEISEELTEDLETEGSSSLSGSSEFSSPSEESSLNNSQTSYIETTRTRSSAINVINENSYELPIKRNRRIINDDTESGESVAKRRPKTKQSKKKRVNDDSTDSCCKKNYSRRGKQISEISEHDGDTTTFSDLSSLSDSF